ncbi:MAG: DEAD/DEAH box helicase family protein [Cellvibrionales bacterium]|nr:DEAD/DEAH box helicase family protein [Cellvibrionales bacterium]
MSPQNPDPDSFFTRPILNSPYEPPTAHWQLDEDGQPTGQREGSRRRAGYVTPVPKNKKRKDAQSQDMLEGEAHRYSEIPIINQLRDALDEWRKRPAEHWRVSPTTARLLRHWRQHAFNDIRPFFCQIEAVEAAIWLTEVAPQRAQTRRAFLDPLEAVNEEANPGLPRLALKLATGAGKTTVMAMLIAWQTLNAVRKPGSKTFTRGFLVVTPGLTIKDRLRVLQPNDPNSYYQSRELVPQDMLRDLERAKIIITNYHAFKHRERLELSKGTRALIQGPHGKAPQTAETEGQMLQRVIGDLMGMQNILVLNDEAHHCYREKPAAEAEEPTLKGEARQEAETNREAARLWISGLETVARKLGIRRIFDLSATPFFLSGSGYREGTLFPWTMSDFSLMDAIECGIVKLPRVPVVDNIPSSEIPLFRNLWQHIRSDMPKKGRGKAGPLDPLQIPLQLQRALKALYDHYEKTFQMSRKAKMSAPPCFIVVCNNTATSKLVYDYIAGFERDNEDGSKTVQNGALELFRNFDEHGHPLSRPKTVLIDSQQLESGEGLSKDFQAAAKAEIEIYRNEIIKRTGDRQAAENLKPQDLLRELMNTVGKPGKLGGEVRCVVSVSMLTEGWDANTVTHVLGVRAFGTQLLCEQVVGRALRRQSYELNKDTGCLDVEYADVFGIPFDFTAKPTVAPPQPPPNTIRVKAIRPDRDALEICFPRVTGYRTVLPDERLSVHFNEESVLELTPDKVGPTITENSGLIGESIELTTVENKNLRDSTLAYELTKHLLINHYRDQNGAPKMHLFGQLKQITRQWLADYLKCKGGTHPAQLMYAELAARAVQRISAAITTAEQAKGRAVQALLDPYNRSGSTRHVNFTTSKTNRWKTDPRRCHIDRIILDSNWEAEFCRVVERHPQVLAYVKNHNLGLEVPYRQGSSAHQYRPDFIVQIDDGKGADDPLNLIVEIKGYRGEDAKVKKLTMDTYWIPGINNSGQFGRWAFAEFTDVYTIQEDFAERVDAEFERMLSSVHPKNSA